MQQTAPILITGASQRIGLHCAKSFLAQGQPVIITYRKLRPAVAELEQLGAICLQADFSSDSSIEAFIQLLHQHCSKLRAIVHNASAWLDDEPDQQPMQQLFNVHVLAPYLINLACEPLLRQCASADIIHIGDDVTRRGSSKRIAYSASKAALENMSMSFAARFAPQIKVNCIAPALIMQQDGDNPNYLQQATDKSVMRSIPGAQVVFEAIKYLLESPYTTGITLPLNGGRHLKN